MVYKTISFSIVLLLTLPVHLVWSELIVTTPIKVIIHQNFQSTSIIYSSDANRLLTAGGGVDQAILWDIASGEPIRSYGDETALIRYAVFSPDESSILTACSDNLARLWETDSGELIKSYSIPLCNDGGLTTAEYSPDGGRIIVGAYAQPDCVDHAVFVLNAESGEILASLATWDGRTRTARYSPNGRLIAISSPGGGKIQLFDAVTFEKIDESDWGGGFNNYFVFTKDSSKIVSASNIILLWDLQENLVREDFHQSLYEDICATFSPNEQYLLVGGRKDGNGSRGKTELWDYVTKTLIRSFEEQPREVTAVAYSPDGKTIATGDARGNIYLWDVSDLAASGVEQWTSYGR